MYHYVYYSYEEWGRGYIGVRSCKCLPEEDTKYFGSFYDKSFKPTEKDILSVFETRKDALKAEIALHDFYEVHKNPHFANKAKQTSVGFSPVGPSLEHLEKLAEISRTRVRSPEELKRLREQSSYAASQSNKNLSPEKYLEKYRKAYENQPEEAKHRCRVNGGLTMGNKHKQEGTGFFSIPKKEADEMRKRNNLILFQCLVTGKISTAPALAKYQRNRGIDTFLRVRLPEDQQPYTHSEN
jgi:hypothetical protein